MFALLTLPRGPFREAPGKDEGAPVFGIVIRPPEPAPPPRLPRPA